LASQRITVAKLGGVGADIVLERFRNWSEVRKVVHPHLWSPEQWPEDARRKADDFAERLRTHGFAPPVVYFVEWSDLWSMGDLFEHWLTPADGPMPHGIHANRYELFAYGLPDGGRLARYLASAGPQQWSETDWFIGRLRDAVEAWQALVDRAAIVVLRQVVDGSALDEEVKASLRSPPAWLS
jgi:hypothetical protein